MRIGNLLAVLLLADILGGCTGPGRSVAPAGADAIPVQDRARLDPLPASFAGRIPCADCPGILYRLNLFPDQTFFSRMTYEERDVVHDDIGRWSLRGDSAILELSGEGERPTLLRIVDRDALRLLDATGREIASGLDYTLRRTERFERIEPRLTMRGLYRYMADAALFTECRTGLRLPVAQEADNVALERGYLAVRREPGEDVLVTIEGRIALRPGMEGDALLPHLVPDRFIAASPGESCDTRTGAGRGGDTAPEERGGDTAPGSRGVGDTVGVPLEGTTWTLVALEAGPIPVQDDERAPTLFLDANERRAYGSGGCNRFGGNYRRDGGRLELGPLVSTRMACATGMEVEQAYFAALERVRSWRVTGRRLELYDADGERVARFEARP